MRFLFKSLVVVLVVFGIGNYLIYLKTGQFPVSKIRENYNGDWLAAIKESFATDKLFEQAKKTMGELTEDESNKPPPTKVYKWTDANGQVHFGDKPDTAGAEQVEVKIQNAISQEESRSGSDPAASTAEQTPLEKARAAAEAMKARNQQQEAR